MQRNKEIQFLDIPAPETWKLEQQVLRDAIDNPETIGDISTIISRDMFSNEDRTKIWDLILEMFHEGRDIDLISVREKGGKAVREEIIMPIEGSSGPVATLSHAALLRDAASKRRAYFACLRLMEKCATPDADEGSIIAASEQTAEEIRGKSSVRGEKHISEIVNEVAEEVQEVKRMSQLGLSFRAPTGFSSLNWMLLGGFAPGQLIILAARPTVGKTAVMLQMAKTAAYSGFPALIFSAELTEVEIGKRLLYSTDRVNSHQVASGDMDWPDFEYASGLLSGLPIYVNDSCIDINDACARVVLAAQRGECRIAFFDYLTRFTIGADNKIPLRQQIGMITKALANTAKRAKIPVVLLAQLNRESAKENRAPELYDLKESGDIEQDADVVMMMNTRMSMSESAPPDVNIWVRKNRQGRKEGCVIVRPSDSYTSFSEIGVE